jgi:hypothetical protein
MVMQPSSPERWCSGLACKSAVTRLAVGARGVIGACTADDVHGAISVRECTADGTGAPPEWLARRPL